MDHSPRTTDGGSRRAWAAPTLTVLGALDSHTEAGMTQGSDATGGSGGAPVS